jgi:DNA-binding ferritin-like protein
MSSTNVHFLFTLRTQLKLHHWQTYEYSTHKATDEILIKLDDLIDEYVETYMGEYGRPSVTKGTGMIQIKNLSEKAVVSFVKEAIMHLQTKFVKGYKASDTALLTIRDEMIGSLQKLLYFLSLNG